jgi:rhomboid protease GluP
MTRQGAILCPNCRKLVNADEPKCPYCGISRPGSDWKKYLGSLRPENLFTYILYANIALYVLSLVLGASSVGMSPNPLTFLSPSDHSLFQLGATGTIPIDRAGRWWTLVSANYLHGSVLHIFFNMAALRQLSPLVLREYGTYRMISLYTLGGVIGFAVSYIAGVPFTIGASAAVCSLIGAMLYYGKSRGGTYGQAVFQSIWGWAVGIFVFGFLVPGINNWGHGGGMAGGLLLGMLLGYQEKGRERWSDRLLAGGCVVVTVAVLAWAVVVAVLVKLLGRWSSPCS